MKNVNMKRLEAIWLLLTTETQLSRYVTEADKATFKRRFEAEGLPFLTCTLPALGKDLDRSFANGYLFDGGLGFKRKNGCAYPLFLSKAYEAIFTKDGLVRFELQAIKGALNETDRRKELCSDAMGAVACLRQLCGCFYKLKLPYTDKQEKSVVDAFLRAERKLRDHKLTTRHNQAMLSRASKFVHRLLGGVNPFEVIPKHGSGSSACGVKPHLRYGNHRFIPRLNAVFPYDNHFYYNSNHLSENLGELLKMVDTDPLAKVVFVPKDSRGPRLISCEPREFMFLQKGVERLICETVQDNPVVARMVLWLDQSRNRRMAQLGSIENYLATVDMKEASDHVSMELVERLFPADWVTALRACRSRGTVLPNGRIVPFNKFAPMGSACCFPVEAICFLAITLAAAYPSTDIVKCLFPKKGVTSAKHRQRGWDISNEIRVLGDDIVCPVHSVHSVMTALESVGLLVNQNKSYWDGPFRESCGGDYFRGHNVTPVRVRTLPSDDNDSRNRTADLMNNLIGKYGYGSIGLKCQLLFEEMYGPVPLSSNYRVVPEDEAEAPHIEKLHCGLSLYAPRTEVPARYRRRFHSPLNKDEPAYQRQEYRVPIEVTETIEVPANSWSSVLRRELQELGDRTVESCALSKRTHNKYGWTTL